MKAPPADLFAADFPHWWCTQLLKWYGQHGRKSLPWKTTDKTDALWYALVSEIMLQQTQAIRVAEYFPRFINRFPNPAALAQADTQQVTAAWSGLGYYRRALFLHRAAKILQQKQEDFLPDAQMLQQLPGVGKSTANAILAQAFNQPLPILDANVKRILARLYGIDSPSIPELWQLAQRLMPETGAADYTQAIMDFGSLVCRKKPLCQQCFAASYCRGLQTDTLAQCTTSRQVTKKTIRLFFAIVIRESRVWLAPQPADQLWPHTLMPPHATSLSALKRQLEAIFGKQSLTYQRRYRLRRMLTHRIVQSHAMVCIHTSRNVQSNAANYADQLQQGWYQPMATELPLSSLVRDLLRRL